ncbi:MAG TPA: UDP-glucose--hexose-1-phosphate uridylyltransferase [Euzebyales bacterium]|nr:UDP-glucose--hexose-1-phosphate uridylyltransferase [Euzebyales bacterium]
MELFDTPHRRYDPLSDRWVMVSPNRTSRPWQGRQEPTAADRRPAYDADCYLCPGNVRAGGERNPRYDGTWAFVNDFAALRPDTPEAPLQTSPLLHAVGQPGTCRVLCFHPRHDLTLARMTVEQIRPIVDLWADQVEELSPRYAWVQLFQNEGATMGASNPHPHGQLWAMTRLPNEAAVEERQQRTWSDDHHRPLLVDYLGEELHGPRILVANDCWVALVPFWAVWPFETLLLPRRHVRRIVDLSERERTALAKLLRTLLVRYDNLFCHPFPYSMGWHGAPGVDGGAHWQLHAHFYPPLLRSASVRKFMVGFEMLGEAQRDLTAEEAAQRLRELPDTHYLDDVGAASA